MWHFIKKYILQPLFLISLEEWHILILKFYSGDIRIYL